MRIGGRGTNLYKLHHALPADICLHVSLGREAVLVREGGVAIRDERLGERRLTRRRHCLRRRGRGSRERRGRGREGRREGTRCCDFGRGRV